ncbi:MAG TPA: type II toxin-antitoxin system RelE/ParE family toxin [Candidatus Angelobacter sp.]|nr:type II toxin-antitoxin system RelE/ParE family toxin [Candidatus Angelobacter sp.]
MKQYTKKSYTSEEYDDKLLPASQAPDLAEVAWLGDSREVLRGFPQGVQQDLGYALYQVQLGQMPPDSKPMKTVGPGVYELRDQDERAWYRVFYVKKILGVVYVLHCFEKRTAQTERKDLEVAKERLKRLREKQREKSKQETDRLPKHEKRSG